MKKIISMLILASMLLSMAAMPALATETEREEQLNAREYSYVSFENYADVDAYASLETIAEYGRFNKPITANCKTFDKTTVTVGEDTLEVFNYFPYETSDETVITGTEGYFFKGFCIKNLIETGNVAYFPGYVMLADDLLYANGTEVTGMRYAVSASATPAVIYDGTERTEDKRTVRSSHVVSRTAETDGSYAVISNNGIKHKIGPVDGEKYSLNSVYLSRSNPIITVADEGKFLSLLVASNRFAGYNYAAKDTAIGVAPKASLNKVIINYEDGDKETKYFVMTNGVGSTNKNLSNAELTIVYAPKQDSWTAADLYGAEKVTAKALNNANSAEHGIADVSALTAKDIIFDNPDILMTDSANVASWVSNRQDSCTLDYGQRVTMANVALKEKEVTSFQPVKFFNYISENIDTAINVGTNTTQVRQAFIPVTVKGASEDYDYFAYVGASTDYVTLLGASVAEYSLSDKIAMLENRMQNAALQSDVDAIDAEKAELIANTIVEESDFDATIVAAYEAKKEEIAAQADELERLEGLKERKYTYLDFEKDRDVFVSYSDLINYGRFNTAATTGSSTARVNEKYTYSEGVELFRYLPHITSDGTAVTGYEDYYYRGFCNKANTNLPEGSERGYVTTSGYAYLLDSFFVDDGTVLSGKRVNAKATNSSKEYYEGDISRVDGNKTITAPVTVEPINEDGYVIIRNDEVLSKIGPVLKTEIKGNAARLGNSAGTAIENVNAKGSTLDVLITSTGINNSSGYKKDKDASDATQNYLAVQAWPTAALQEIIINYKDGTYESKKMLVTQNASSASSNTPVRSLVIAPKYKDGEKIIYNERSFYLDSENFEFEKLTASNVAKTGLSIEDINKDTVKFENDDIIWSEIGTLASLVNNRQDVANSDYGAYTACASIPLLNKEIDTIAFSYNISAALNEPSAIIVSNEETSSASPTLSLIPVEVEGANDDYVFFVYCGRVAQDSYLMAATIMEKSAREKIDEATAAMEAITENSSLTEANKAKELYEFATKAEGVVPSKDFDSALVEEFFEIYTTIRENTPLDASVSINFYSGSAPQAKITIENEAKLAGKPYRVMMAYYDEKGVMVGKDVVEGVTTEEETIKLEMVNEEYPKTATKVKVMVWKDLSTILPLADVTEAQAIEKKIYMFVGDSIIHGDYITKPIELYYMTRFPYSPAEFYNKGRGGSTATSTIKRYDWDIQAQDATHVILQIGTNDIGYTSYSDGDSELTPAKQAKIDTTLTNITTLLGMLAEDYNEVIYMTPPISDDRDYTGARAKYTGVNVALEKLAEGAKAIAEENGYGYIDNFSVIKAVNEKAGVKDSGAVEMYSTDRVHPNAQGGYVLAQNAIKNLFPDSGVVAEVVINATTGASSADNAEVKDVEATTEGVKYTYQPKALPWTYTDAYKKTDDRYVEMTDVLNREIIKVEGLSAGTYTLKMDGITVGTFTNEELSAGVNIAILPYNPGQIQSGEVNKLNELKHNYVAEIRNYALAKEGLINAGAIDRVTGEIIDRDKFDATVANAVNNQAYCYKYYENYETYDKQYPTWVEECEKLTIQMRETALPKAHTVEIIK